MPGSLVELQVEGGLPTLRCPVTGTRVYGGDEGFDPGAAHSPFLRFFLDWVGELYLASPEGLPSRQKDYAEGIRKLWIGRDFENQNDFIARVCKLLPESAMIFEVLDPPRGGGHTGEICYACFDFEPVEFDTVGLTEVVQED